MPKAKKKKKVKVSPKFYCDSCGTEVGQEATVCPKCGKLFASVRCPACGFVGEVNLFDEGCPACGYSPEPGEKSEKSGRQVAPKHKVPSNTLPLWVYIVAGAAFAGALALLLLTIMK
jgi:predicted RNA-binding Zn-ribbon protein involved in translation (DUF1610 family)